MKIEVYMASIDQDFSSRTLENLIAKLESRIGTRSRSMEAKLQDLTNWANWGNWGNWDNWDNWTNWSNFSAAQNSRTQDLSPLSGCIRLRSESFGGLAYNPISRRVFRIDEEAFRVLNLLVEGSSVENAAAEIGVQKTEIDNLVSYVNKL